MTITCRVSLPYRITMKKLRGIQWFEVLTNYLLQVFRKSRKMQPEAAEVRVTKSHKYEVKKMCKDEGYNKEVTLEDEENMYPTAGMFGNRAINNQPDGKKRTLD